MNYSNCLRVADDQLMNDSRISIIRREIPDDWQGRHEHPLVSRLLASRGVTSTLDFGLNQLPDPATLIDIDKATAALAQAIKSRQRILVVGDYDCDGATSTALALLALRAMGAADVDYLLPSRFKHGYGLSPTISDMAKERGAELVLTVDNGISSVDGVERSNELGMQVVVTDHHLPPAVLPRAAALINPNMPGARFPSGNIAGVGVIFFVMIALRKYLGDSHWFTEQQLTAPNLAEFLDLVAVGTVADVVILDGVNRILVEQGLRRIRAGRARPGVLALLDVAGKQAGSLVSQDIGFIIGPRLNAAGRIDDMSVGVECLLADAPDEARALAVELDLLNNERKKIEKEMRDQTDKPIRQMLETLPSKNMMSLCLYEPGWHQGVIGILAGRLKDNMNLPVVVFAPGDDGRLKGSGRSIAGLHILDTLKAVRNKHPELFEKFGGHAMAAGVEIAERDFAEFRDAFDTQVREFLHNELPARSFHTDGLLDSDYMTVKAAELLKSVAPWGQGFAAPLFDGFFTVNSVSVMKEEHLRLQLVSDERGRDEPEKQRPMPGRVATAIYFRCMRPGDKPPVSEGQRIRVVYRLEPNYFRGAATVQMFVEHLSHE